MRKAVSCIGIVLLLLSCGGDSLLPKGGGRPYEVLLVDDRDSLVYHALDADAEGLPQSEPSFDISIVDRSHYNQAVKQTRSIIIVNVDSVLFSRTRIRYEKNLYARPQLVVYVGTPSVTALKRDMPALSPRLRMLLTRFEMNVEITRLKRKHNIEAEKLIRKMFGASMWVPAEMTASKRGSNFLWISDNASSGMRNLCIYRLGAADTRNFIRLRDSVMQINIKGESDAMFMKTVSGSCSVYPPVQKTDNGFLVRGLWEMKGDAMGGPFVCRIIQKDGGVLVAEAFVYAPEMKKRNRIRQLEASLYTLTTK